MPHAFDDQPPGRRRDDSSNRVSRGVLFADVCDSTGLFRRLGDAGGRRAVVAALGVAREVVVAGSGRVIDEVGDEIFCVFPDGTAAARGAMEIQRGIKSARRSGDLHERIRLRIGLVEGLVGLDGERVFGDTVHLAQRVVSSAKPEQVLTTSETVDAAAGELQPLAHVVARVRLRGRTDWVDLVELHWGGEMTVIAPGVISTTHLRHDSLAVDLSCEGQRIAVGPERPRASIGRDSACELSVRDDRVSRLHARVEIGADAVRWVDVSRNGSFIRNARGDLVRVRRDEVPLEGEGSIRLGPDEDAPRVDFVVRRASGSSTG
ncbi:MAG: FHA domain-containing protein [Planctomycetota bacterium]